MKNTNLPIEYALIDWLRLEMELNIKVEFIQTTFIRISFDSVKTLFLVRESPVHWILKNNEVILLEAIFEEEEDFSYKQLLHMIRLSIQLLSK